VVSAALGLLAGAGLALPLQDVGAAGQAGEHAFLELSAARSSCYVHEVLRVELRFGFERDFLQTRLIQPFQRRLDVPAQLHAGWLEGLPCAEPLPAAEAVDPGASFALEETVARARRLGDEQRDGRAFAVFALDRQLHVTCPGLLELQAPYLRFAYATRFEQDVFGERVALDRRDEVVAGQPLRLEVLPLPEAGRPAGFTGAVGRLDLRAEASPRELAVGESLKLALTIEGRGDLDHFEPPRLERLEGLRVLGWVEQRAPGRRTVVYDLAPLDERVAAVPAVALPYFDPGPPARYRTARTEPLAITVRPRPAPADGTAAPDGTDGGPGVGVGEPVAPAGPDARSRVPVLLGAAGLALVLVGALLMRRRSRPQQAPAADPQATRAAVERLRRRAATSDDALTQALAEYLADRLGCPQPAVIAPDLRARLVTAGVGSDAAARAAALLDELVTARYGGQTPAAALERAVALVEELEPAFQARAQAG
jgi:hypothetical protein